LERNQLDSFGEDDEGGEAHLPVVSARRGSAHGDGTVELTVRPAMVPCSFSSLREEEEGGGETEEVTAAGGERG
jgi:hypothetical protein